MHNFGSLAIETTDRLISLQERHSKFILKNPNSRKILKICVDRDVAITGKKCDWLLIEISTWFSMFIELKGRDFEQALEQLHNSIKIISNPSNGYIYHAFNKIFAFLIARHIPLATTYSQNKMKLFRKLNATLILKTRLCTHEIT